MQHGAYETDKGMELRREVIKELNVLVQQWTQSLSLGMRMQWQDNEKVCGRIVTFGSYFLGISHQGADIDALCITPQHITREDYFHSFYKLLESRPEVSDLRGLEDAFVPVIKMRYTKSFSHQFQVRKTRHVRFKWHPAWHRINHHFLKGKHATTLQSMMNAKLSNQRF